MTIGNRPLTFVKLLGRHRLAFLFPFNHKGYFVKEKLNDKLNFILQGSFQDVCLECMRTHAHENILLNSISVGLIFSQFITMSLGVSIHWTGLLDWNTGLDWTAGLTYFWFLHTF